MKTKNVTIKIELSEKLLKQILGQEKQVKKGDSIAEFCRDFEFAFRGSKVNLNKIWEHYVIWGYQARKDAEYSPFSLIKKMRKYFGDSLQHIHTQKGNFWIVR